ncbi:hypothetical protein [Pseudomonas sp. MPR-ANC1]|uniref:hypothetical protein n=1 Tax=Pseudomonas sp. MPR-ANC1 TaxID=2075548 RepID=UPI002113FA6F|nr:hypothetical protein [Pseudomonas sp. MPR-ANC1]
MMLDSLENNEFDRLEEQLLEASVSFGEMTCEYTRYLLGLIQRGKLDAISSAKLELLLPYLKAGLSRERIEGDEAFRKKLKVELWQMEQQYRKTDECFVNFVRAVLYCFGTEEIWEEEGDGGTPVYLYFLILKRILPGLRRDFISNFYSFLEHRI